MPRPGQVISHYRLQSKLGEGAVGVVYSAEDLILGRRVALKFLSSEFSEDPRSIERLKREARTASLLSHPHICTIYEIEQYESAYFIAMELLEGQTLEQMLHSGPLELPRVLRWGVQVCRALEAAAERGIVHRDLKPANIFITKRGGVKLLDFGLAMVQPQPHERREPDEPRNIRLTFPGLVVGTVAYMSPEQAAGEALDSRSDLFSLGIVLYELATGELPFRGAGWNATIEKILHSEPVAPESINPDLPPSFGQVIGKCLQKLPQARYQTPGELAEALQQLLRELGLTASVSSLLNRAPISRQVVASTTLALLIVAAIATFWWARHYSRTNVGQVTLAVMPFQYLGDDSSLNFLELALPDQITNVLTHVNGVTVRPFESARRFAGADDPQTVGRALGVRNVLSGRYWVVGNEITITLELVDVDRDRVIWQDTLSGNLRDQPALRNTLATSAREQLLPAMGVASASTETENEIHDAQAYELYLHAVALSRDPEPNLNAIAMLEHSVAADSQYAPAWDELANRYYYDAQYGSGGSAAFSKAFDAFQRAAQLDPKLTDAVVNIPELMVEKGELYAAYDQALKVLQEHHGNSDALFGFSYILRYGGDLASAADYCNRAERAAPGYYAYRSCALAFLEKGDLARANHFAELDAGSQWSHNVLAEALVRQHKEQEALAQKRLAGTNDLLAACLAHRPYAEIDDLAQKAAHPVLNDPGDKYENATVEAYCGQSALAVQLMQQAVQGNFCSYPAMDFDPLFDNIRQEPDFLAVRAAAIACNKKFLKHRAETAWEATN